MSLLGIRTTASRKTQTTWAIAITIGIVFLTLAFLRTHQRQEVSNTPILSLPTQSNQSTGVKIEIDKTQSPPVKIEPDKPNIVSPNNSQ